MDNLSIIEECYQRYIHNLERWLPEGLVEVNLQLLWELGLLDFHNPQKRDEHALSQYFHVIETEEKITLINQQFVIWIVPEKQGPFPTTYALIALNGEEIPNPETAFYAQGVYNSSWLVLRVLEKLLFEIEENNKLINNYTKKYKL